MRRVVVVVVVAVGYCKGGVKFGQLTWRTCWLGYLSACVARLLQLPASLFPSLFPPSSLLTLFITPTHSTVIHERGSPETLRDPRGFAVKFYTREGNFDMVGNNIPVSSVVWCCWGTGWL